MRMRDSAPGCLTERSGRRPGVGPGDGGTWKAIRCAGGTKGQIQDEL